MNIKDDRQGGSENEEVRNLVVRDPQGSVVLHLGLLMTLYFREGHTAAVRRRVAQLFEEYREICGSHLKWAHPGKSGFQRLDGSAYRVPECLLRQARPNQVEEMSGWEFYWHGGATKEEASDFRIRGVGASPRFGDELSFFSASLPLSWYVDYDGSFASLVVRWCQTLSPVHGYAGIGILESPRLSVAQAYGRVAYAMARRFPGLELDDPLTHALYLKTGVKGGNWLTILSEPHLAAVGGLRSLSGRLSDGFEFHAYPGGVVIQTGRAPELGDVNRGITPVRLRRLMNELRSLRPSVHGGFQQFGLSREQSEEWLARFDRENP